MAEELTEEQKQAIITIRREQTSKWWDFYENYAPEETRFLTSSPEKVIAFLVTNGIKFHQLPQNWHPEHEVDNDGYLGFSIESFVGATKIFHPRVPHAIDPECLKRALEYCVEVSNPYDKSFIIPYIEIDADPSFSTTDFDPEKIKPNQNSKLLFLTKSQVINLQDILYSL